MEDWSKIAGGLGVAAVLVWIVRHLLVVVIPNLQVTFAAALKEVTDAAAREREQADKIAKEQREQIAFIQREQHEQHVQIIEALGELRGRKLVPPPPYKLPERDRGNRAE